jgi:NADH-quinone oxidoreductase subunit F
MAELFYRAHVLCCRGTGCSAGASESIFEALQEEVKKHHLEDEVRVGITGCHGLCEMGPNLVIYPDDILYTHVTVDDVNEVVEETLVKGRPVERLLYQDPRTAEPVPHYHEIPFYGNQVRVVLQNCGFIDPENIEEYIARDGYTALAKVLTEMTPEEVIEEVKRSGLRGRGGGGFLTGLKWEFTRKAKGEPKYLIANSDEGDPGAFMDRSLDEGDPHSILEGMLIAAHATAARKGFIYCRAEYPLAVQRFKIALSQARDYGFLGASILGTDFSFDIELKEGAGAFVCGEETALMASIMGERGMPRPRPPFPAVSGLWGKPTNINNVKSYATVPQVILKGADWFSSMGTRRSKGTMVYALTGQVNNTGLLEVPMGSTLGEIVFDIGAGIQRDRQLKAVQIGGPLGGCLPAELLNTRVDYESITATGAIMGSGGMIVVDDHTCMVEFAKFFLTFATKEACGQCTPCRVGGRQMLEILTRITEGQGTMEDLEMLEDLSKVMDGASLCALGQLTPNPVLTTLKYFRDEYIAHIVDKRCPAGVCEALVPARCHNACPAEVNVPLYVRLVADGEYAEALKVHRQANPFPLVCGRVCPHFCEDACRRGELDEPVAIRALKRFMADREMAHPWTPPQLEEDKEQRVAIVGSGPAGLTAALRLAQLGYRVSLFEALPVIGGMMAVGIPDYRLPKDILRNDIEAIERTGKVEFVTNTRVGRDISLRELREKYDVVFIAVGAHRSGELGIPGEDKEGVIHGTEFLRDMNLGNDMSYVKGKRVAVVGGGNVAIDAARSAVRLGASEVHILYRRRREDMPADEEEVRHAEEEGVKLHFLVIPLEHLGDGRVEAVLCQRMKLKDEEGQPVFDRTARKRPFPIDGAEFTMAIDLLIPAIGQTPDLSFLDGMELEKGRGGTIVAAPRTFATSVPGIFAGGDAVSGPATVIEAIAAGNKAAEAIDRYLKAQELPLASSMERPTEGIGEFEMLEEDAERPRQKTSIVTPEVRAHDFREVDTGFPLESIACAEARRCLRCDLEEME